MSSFVHGIIKQQVSNGVIDTDVFLGVNASVFTFNTCLSLFVLIKTSIRGLDIVSLCSMAAVWISFLVRTTNWIIFKTLTFSNDFDRNTYFTSIFLIVDTTGTTIFLLNA
jgi:hypothetical protein